jgi:hypothetical protein
MSLLQGILKNKGEVQFPSVSKDESDRAKRLAYLIAIVRAFGWESLIDTRAIKPNLRQAQLYIRKNMQELNRLFDIDFSKIKRGDIVDIINPILISMWHVQIVGSPESAYLEMLIPK